VNLLIHPQNRPDRDSSAPGLARRTFVIATTPRTGSTLLCHALAQTGRVGTPREYLAPMQIRDFSLRFGTPAARVRALLLRGPLRHIATLPDGDPASVRAYLDAIRQVRSGPTGWFGLKLHPHQSARWLDADPEAVLGPCTWIRLRRADRVGQAISWVRARQTGRFVADAAGWGVARYDRRAIARALDAIDTGERAWDALLEGRPTLQLTYERLTDDLTRAVAATLHHLDEPAPTGSLVVTLRRQADARTQRWRARWAEEAAS